MLVNQLIDPKKKGKSYYLRYAKAIYDAYKNGKTYPSKLDASALQSLMDYYNGNINPDRYIAQSRQGEYDKDVARKGLQNIVRHVSSIMTGIRRAITNAFSEYDEDVYVVNIDEDSRNEELDKMYETLVEIKEKEWFDGVLEAAGIDVSSINESPFPNSISSDELELFYKIGGFKLNYARISEKLLKYTEMYSRWNDELKIKLLNNLLSIGFFVLKTEYDSVTGKIKYKYVNPLSFGIQKSDSSVFDDSEFAIVFEVKSISALRQYGVPEDELIKAAKSFSGMFDNPHLNYLNSYSYNPNDIDKDLISNYKVLTAECVWIDTDIDRRLKYTNIYGKTKLIDVDFDYKPNLSDKQKKRGAKAEIIDTYVRTVKFAKWVVGTDIVYQYGKYPNQTRKNPKEPELPYVVVRLENNSSAVKFQSLTSDLMTYIDGFANALIKFHDARAKALEHGIAINLRLLANLRMDGKNVSETQAIESLKKTGVLPYLDVAVGRNYMGGDVKPLHVVEGNLGLIINNAITELEYNIKMITRISGINVDMIQNYNANDVTKETFKMYHSYILSAIKDEIKTVYKAKKMVSEIALRLFKIILYYDDYSREIYSNVVGIEDINTFLLGIRNDVEYGIFLETRASEEEKLRLLEMAKSIITKVDGEAMPNFLDTYLYIENLIYSGANIKEIKMRLMFAVQKTREELEKLNARRYEQTAQANAYPVQLETQKQITLKQIEGEQKLAEINSKMSEEIYKENINYLKELESELSDEITKIQ